MAAVFAPTTEPYQLAEDTWLIPRLVPAGPQGFVFINSLVIRGEEPVIVDTGAAVHREQWREDVFSLVEPTDVRWIFISHEDADHVGNLPLLLETCPNATVLTDLLGMTKLGVLQGLPPTRCRWLNPGEVLRAGDRTVRAVRPPLFDSAGTRGLFDEATGALWAVDSFATPTPVAVCEATDLPADLWADGFRQMNSLENPWHAWLDPVAFGSHVDAVAGLSPSAIASCHGPVLRGERLDRAFAMTRNLAGQPPAVTPGQPLLDEIIAAALAAAESPTLTAAQIPAPATPPAGS